MPVHVLSVHESEANAMPYVIQRTDGAYVSRPGSRASYTFILQHARAFPTRESAERELCPGNERVLSVDEAMR